MRMLATKRSGEKLTSIRRVKQARVKMGIKKANFKSRIDRNSVLLTSWRTRLLCRRKNNAVAGYTIIAVRT